MKKIFRISLLALFVGLVSCEDATDIIQASELPEDTAYQTVDDLRSGLIGAYARYSPDAGDNGANGDIILFNDLFTDNFKRGMSNSGQGNQIYSFIVQPATDVPNVIWGGRYAVINFVNRTLRAWDRIYPTLEDETDIVAANEIKAQLLALRGFCHFELLQYFSPSYESDSPSVIIMDFVPEPSQVFPRNTVGEVFEFIDNDLNMAADLMGSSFETIGDYASESEAKFYINPDVIIAMKARVALFEGNYSEASALTDQLFGNGYAMAGDSNDDQIHANGLQAYANVYLNDDLSSPEVIWNLSRRQGDNAVMDIYSPNGAGIGGSPFFEASNQLYNLYSSNDIRKSINFHPESVFNGLNSPNNILLQGKYRGSGDSPKINDVKIFRTTEMMLIKAEAQARLGALNDAATTMQRIRNARFITQNAELPAYSNLNDALADILVERRKELVFEGHRYLDLKRIGSEINVGINRNDADCSSYSAPCELSAGDYRFTLPIPNNEISANPTIEQNPGY